MPQSIEKSMQEIEMDTSSYVPMSPQMKDLSSVSTNAQSNIIENSKEGSYVIMR